VDRRSRHVGVPDDRRDLLAVAVLAAFGPDFKSFDISGSNTTIPSGILVALFAMFATMSVAKHGFDPKERTKP
jgi:hypothetical protein